MNGVVQSVHLSPDHTMHKRSVSSIRLLAGLGVAGDAHAGATVKHRSRVRADPSQPNLRQIHLLHHELLSQLVEQGFDVAPGRMGENITTHGLELLDLPGGTLLCIGGSAVVKVTGLRNPCVQLDGIQPGLMAAVLGRDKDGHLIRRAGIMGTVTTGGLVQPGDDICVVVPREPHRRLDPV